MTPEQVKVLILDVDGVLTDGRLYLSEDGTETKSFHVHDGQGLVDVLAAGIQIVVISSRPSAATHARLQALGIQEIHLDCSDKYARACEVLERLDYRWEQAVCLGDDRGDVPLLQAAGMGVAVADARNPAREVADWVTPHAGGQGAVRDVCDWLLAS